MHPDLTRCAHPGCPAWALRGHRACGVHAGPTYDPPRPIPAFPAGEALAAPGPHGLVIAMRDSLHRYLALRPGWVHPRLAEELRLLREFSRVAVALAPTLPTESATDELYRFLDMIGKMIVDEGAAEGAGLPPPPLPPELTTPGAFPQIDAGWARLERKLARQFGDAQPRDDAAP